jgi:hypothetical protein
MLHLKNPKNESRCRSTFLILGLSAAAALAEKPDWRAQWIGATTNNAENAWSIFRRNFPLF